MGEVGLLEIFLVMLLGSLFSLGGGSGQIPVIQARWVEPGVLAPELFSFSLAITYLAPGPRAGFIAGVGYYLAGFPGAAVAILGVIVPTCLGAAAVSYSLTKITGIIRSVTPSAQFVIAGLIAAAAWRIAVPLELQVLEILATAVVAVLIGWRNVDPIWLVLLAVGVGAVWSLAGTLEPSVL